MSGAFSLQRLEGSIASPIEGFLVDRFGPRRLVLAGAFIAGLGLISLAFMESLWMFYGSVLLVSLGNSACVGIPRNWAIVQWFRRLRGRAMGIGASGAVISGPLVILVVWLVEAFGWRAAFVVMGLVTWLVCIPLALVFRSRPEQYGYLPDGDPPEPEEAPSSDSPPGRGRSTGDDAANMTVRQALRSRAFWVLTLVFGAQTMGVSGLVVHFIPYFESIGFTRAEAASVLGFYTVLSIFGRLGSGWLMDFVDKRVVLAGLLSCQAVGFLILANITSYWHVVPFALLYGTAFGGMMPARGMIISSFFGRQSFGAIHGLSQSATVVSGMVAPILMGWVFDQTQSYIIAIYILTAVAAIAVPLAFLARPPQAQAQ